MRDALNRSHELLLAETAAVYDAWYDDETALAGLTAELAEQRRGLQGKADQLRKRREDNAQLAAQLGVVQRQQGVPDAIRERREALAAATAAAAREVSEEEERLVQLELMLMDAAAGQ